jgi:tripartite-type tricarboxylate transporter receptor subunit TctC
MKKLIAAVLLASASTLVIAQAWPSAKPIRLIVGYPPGGGIDFAARTVQVPLQEALKQQIVVDYKPGAGGLLAAGELTRAAPDGYTLLLANTGPFAIAPWLQQKLPYDPVRQFTYIGQISQGSYIAATRLDHPAKDLKEWVAWARANAGKVNFASGGAGTSTHLNGELMNQATGLDVTHVPYKGSAPAVQDLMGGQTQLLIDAGSVLLPQIKGSGQQPGQLFVTEARTLARFFIERRVQAWRLVALHQHAVVRHRVQPVALAQPAVPVVADGHMADLVAQDDVQDVHRAQAAGCATLRSLSWMSGVASSPRASSVRGTSAMRATMSPRVFSHICHRLSWAGKSP